MSDGDVLGARPTSVELHSLADRVQIAPSVFMPRLGIGTSHVVGADDVEREVLGGLEIGYRSVDTATSYGNEAEIGAALRKSGVAREELFVTTKVWPADQGYEGTLRAFDASRSRLGLDYVDLYLIHWPEPSLTAQTWRAFEELYATGAVRAIGVSNFMKSDFAQLLETANVTPAVNQIEFHPYLQRPELVEYCRSIGVTVEAWSPLMRGRISTIRELRDIAEHHAKSVAQVTLRWILQRGIVTVPKSTHQDRLQENADIFDFALTSAEMDVIDALDRGEHES